MLDFPATGDPVKGKDEQITCTGFVGKSSPDLNIPPGSRIPSPSRIDRSRLAIPRTLTGFENAIWPRNIHALTIFADIYLKVTRLCLRGTGRIR
jgi:hypothetical protein